MNASELFVRCLENEGVEVVFGLPGEEMLDLLEALRRSKIRFLPTRHEQAAAFMADIYGRLTGRAGVCLSTLGPGALNLATGIADATLDHAPVVAVTAQTSLAQVHKESHQYVNIVDVFRPLTKWNTRIERASVITEVVRKAFKTAQQEKPGACHLELPEDIASSPAEGEPLASLSARRPSADRDAVARAAEMIERAKMPVLLAGNGVIRGRASAALRALSEKMGIPVATTFMGAGAVPFDYDLSLLSIGLQAHDAVSFGFDRADLILAVGYDLVEYAPALWNPEKDKTIIHVDFTPGETDANYQPSVELVGDVAGTLALLAGQVSGRKATDFPRTLRTYILKEFEESASDPGMPMKPQRILHEIRRALRRDDLLVCDVGAHKMWVARMFPAYEPNTVIISNGLAAMGIGLPGALAAKLVHPHKNVVAVCGDGGFLMNCHELETSKRLGLPVVVVIFNDGGYGLIKWKQVLRYGFDYGCDFSNPDFVALARSFGVRGARVERPEELETSLKEAFASGETTVIDVPVDYGENLKLTEKLGHLICPI